MKKISLLNLLVLPLLFLWGCSLINSNDALTNTWEVSISETPMEENYTTWIEDDSLKMQEISLCWKKIKISDYRSIISGENYSFNIRTEKKDTKWYDVYVLLESHEKYGFGPSDMSEYKDSFENENVVEIDSAWWIHYWIKIDNETMCTINADIYTNQPIPSDLNYDWQWTPEIDDAIIIKNEIFDALKASFN